MVKVKKKRRERRDGRRNKKGKFYTHIWPRAMDHFFAMLVSSLATQLFTERPTAEAEILFVSFCFLQPHSLSSRALLTPPKWPLFPSSCNLQWLKPLLRFVSKSITTQTRKNQKKKRNCVQENKKGEKEIWSWIEVGRSLLPVEKEWKNSDNNS